MCLDVVVYSSLSSEARLSKFCRSHCTNIREEAKTNIWVSEVDYRLQQIFERVAKEFEETDVEAKQLENEFERTKESLEPPQSIQMIQRMFAASDQRREAGVVLLMTAAALLEQVINDYAHTFLEPELYDEHLGKVRIITKWILLPLLCQGKQIREDDPAIKSLGELIRARNDIIHRKRKEMYSNPVRAMGKTSSEGKRFLSACRHATGTVGALLKILDSPPSR